MYCFAKSIIDVSSSAPKKYKVTSWSISLISSLLSSDTEYIFSSVKSKVGKLACPTKTFIKIYTKIIIATSNKKLFY